MNSSLADLIAQGHITKIQKKDDGLEIEFNLGCVYPTIAKLTVSVENYQEVYDAEDLINKILSGI